MGWGIVLDREYGLRQWVSQQLDSQSDVNIALLSGDASFRRYFRVHHGVECFIAVDAPPETEKNAEFVAISAWFSERGIAAPQVIASDLQAGYLLLSDLGDQLLLPLLNETSKFGYYDAAIDLLIKMQSGDTASLSLPAYSAAFLHQEMALFPQWFVEGALDYSLQEEEKALLENVFSLLIDSAMAQPQLFVHRDYHSRNIMMIGSPVGSTAIIPPGSLATIDFQDAVMGPLTYDLVSLLRDCYVQWPDNFVRERALQYAEQAKQKQLLASVKDDVFLQWFDWMGLQRHIKVLGIFARLSLRDNKHGYLDDLPLVIRYTLSVASLYPELAVFYDWFESRLMPIVRKQPWWSEAIA